MGAAGKLVFFWAAAACCLSVELAQARPLSPAEERTIPYSGDLPACDSSGVLNLMSWRVSRREWRFWDLPLEIVSYGQVREIGYRSNGADFIPRRYCAAQAVFSDGRVRDVIYNLIEGGGFIGVGYGLEWCVVGLDREYNFAPACKAAGP